jgi:hypothetical protein
MSIFKNRRLDLKKYSYIDSSYIFGEMEHDGMLLFITKIVLKSSHKRRVLARSGGAACFTYLQKTFPIKSAPTNPSRAPRW